MKRKPDSSVAWLTATAWASLVMYAGGVTLVSISLKHIGEDLDVGYDLLGALATPRSCAIAVAALLTGYAADRIGKRWLLVCGALIIAIGLLWTARSETYLGLMGTMFLAGVGLGCMEALVSPLVAELHPRSVAAHMNVLHAFFPLGLVGSSLLLGPALDRGVPWRTPFMVAAVPAAVVALMFTAGRYPDRSPSERRTPLRLHEIVTSRTFWLLAAAMALTAGGEGALIHWSPNFIQTEYGAGAQTGSYGLIAFSAAMAVGRFGTGAAVRFVPLTKLMIAMAILSAGATLCVALVSWLGVTMVALALAGLFGACFWPSILSLASERIASGSATLFAVMAVAGIGGVAVVPLAVGAVAERLDLRAGLCLLPGCFLAAALAIAVVAKTPKRAA